MKNITNISDHNLLHDAAHTVKSTQRSLRDVLSFLRDLEDRHGDLSSIAAQDELTELAAYLKSTGAQASTLVTYLTELQIRLAALGVPEVAPEARARARKRPTKFELGGSNTLPGSKPSITTHRSTDLND